MFEAAIQETLLALADPTRRAILQRLSHGEARVTEIARPFDVSLNAISKHIKILERAQLVQRRKKGREYLIAFNPQPLDDAVIWMQTMRDFWTKRLDKLEQLLKAEDVARKKRHRRDLKMKGESR